MKVTVAFYINRTLPSPLSISEVSTKHFKERVRERLQDYPCFSKVDLMNIFHPLNTISLIFLKNEFAVKGRVKFREIYIISYFSSV